MSILISGMEMPKGCAACPYCDRVWNKPKCKAKSMQGRFMEQRLYLDSTRQKWCPLVALTPHGRLIDAELESRNILDKIKADISEYGSIWVEYTVNDMSTEEIVKVVDDVLRQVKEQVLNMIDKYKTESENNV